jgi:CRISPR-associated protein (TIGR02584 family)
MTSWPPAAFCFAVTGLSPQIVTETLYALAVAPAQAAFVPTEIHLITTRSGAEKARLALLSDDPGWFHQLCRDYALPPIDFAAKHIHVLADADGQALEDIRSPDDNRRAADGITEIVREFTADPDCALHVSIAGGRKTMGFFLGYALSLYGRPQDQLSHVLVSEPFESSIAFYYPTPASRVIELPGGRLADAASAQVTLAELPFVSLRHGLPEALLTGHASYNQTVEAARRALAPPELQLDLATRRIRAAGKAFALPPAELALLSVFARRALRGEGRCRHPTRTCPRSNGSSAISSNCAGSTARRRTTTPPSAPSKKAWTAATSRRTSRSSRRSSERQLGPAAAPYLISDGGSRPRLYRLDLRPSAVNYVHVQVPEQHAATLNNILSGA